MIKRILALLFVASVVYGQFPYHENTGTFNATTNATGKYDAFDWAWMGYDDQIINVTLLPSGSTAVAFRMCYPKRGTVYLESTTGTLTGGTNYSLSIARTNLPPNGIYFAEFMGYENNATTMPTRVLATGQINIQRSLWQNTTQSTWTNPLAGTVIGPPVHTLSALSGWPFLTTNAPDGTTIIYSNGQLTAVGFDPAGSAAAVSNAAWAQGWISVEADTNALAQLLVHTERTYNPHGLTASVIGADPEGAAAGALGDFTALLDGHRNRVDNPHAVTAAQVGALTNASAFDPAGSAAAR
mgnify:CR=1 FL=1